MEIKTAFQGNQLGSKTLTRPQNRTVDRTFLFHLEHPWNLGIAPLKNKS